jgi:predicted CopG family antitoxin
VRNGDSILRDLNLTVRDEQRNKLEQMASLENRSVSNLIEVMADERWKRLAVEQGVGDATRL